MSPKVSFCDLLELPISFCAKNASTTTMRIGNAALLKNLLIVRKCGAGRAKTPGPGLPSVASGLGPPNSLACGRSLLQRSHERQVSVPLLELKSVADRETVRNLEADILGP